MDKQYLQTIGSRTSTLYIIVLLVGFIFIGRLFYLQVVRYDYYQEQALSEHQSKFEIPASRGTIFAKDGDESTPLVLNQTLPTVYADPQGIKDAAEVAAALAPIIDVEEKDLLPKLIQVGSRYQVLQRRLTLDQAKQVEELDLRGVGLVDATYRVYPQQELASQLLGFVNNEGLGQYGLEEALQDQLDGEEGRLRAVTDVYGIPLPTIESNIVEKPIAGDDLTLTIDVNVQRFVEDALKQSVEDTNAKSGSIFVMDPNTGAVMAMANYPTYNPEKINEIEDFSVLLNEAVTSPYETGSGIKVFTMAAGLAEGVVNSDSTYLDKGSIDVDGVTIKNATFDSEIVRSMQEVIQRSINTGVVHILEQLGGGQVNEQARSTLYSYFTDQFKFGSTTGIEQANEAQGTVFAPNEGDGLNVRYANMSFGQGMTVTMVQLASAISAVVNGGTYYQPHLVESATHEDGTVTATESKVVQSNVVTPSTAQDLRDMMELVVLDGGGRTARRSGYTIGGKTGTAQVPDENGQYSKDKTIGSFVGFGGGAQPEYVIMTRVNEPKTPGFAGTEVAAPLFAKVSNWLIDYYQIPPQ